MKLHKKLLNAENNSQQRVFCRELAATLNRNINISLHAVTLKQTLSAIAGAGLRFISSPRPIAIQRRHVFQPMVMAGICSIAWAMFMV